MKLFKSNEFPRTVPTIPTCLNSQIFNPFGIDSIILFGFIIGILNQFAKEKPTFPGNF